MNHSDLKNFKNFKPVIMKRKAKVNTMGSLADNIGYFYPELYEHIFNDGITYTSLTIFLDKNQIPSTCTSSDYRDIWKYIYKNEDKHDWWML